LQALVLLHVKSRSLLTSAQYLQLVTARACEVPACLPHALHTLLALLQVRAGWSCQVPCILVCRCCLGCDTTALLLLLAMLIHI
jgi:hypothetical protein